jgi:hypothetical protein
LPIYINIVIEKFDSYSRLPTMSAAIHTEHLSHAFALGRDDEPIVVLEDISIDLPPGSRTILVQTRLPSITPLTL